MANQTAGTWTEDRIATLTKMYAQGYSCRAIGAEMGLTRNAVIGKVGRLKLSPPVDKKPFIWMGREVGLPRPPRPPRLLGAKLAPSPIELFNIPLTEAGPFHCRWIEGDEPLVCGHEVYQRSFCQHHYFRCYDRPRKMSGIAA